MMADNSNKKDLYNRVRKDVEMHNIFSKSDQGQLADIIKQLGNKSSSKTLEKSVNKAQGQTANKEEAVNLSLKEKVVTDEEIIFLLDRLSEFDLDDIESSNQVYEVYMEKLKYYQRFDNYKKIIKQAKYHNVLIAHLDYLGSKVIEQEHQAELQNAVRR